MTQISETCSSYTGTCIMSTSHSIGPYIFYFDMCVTQRIEYYVVVTCGKNGYLVYDKRIDFTHESDALKYIQCRIDKLQEQEKGLSLIYSKIEQKGMEV